jgi:hypothetical protein
MVLGIIIAYMEAPQIAKRRRLKCMQYCIFTNIVLLFKLNVNECVCNSLSDVAS